MGSLAGAQPVLEEAARRCDRYLTDRRAIDANLADGVVGLAARIGDDARHRQFVDAAARATTPQEQRRFLLVLGAFREPRLVAKSLSLSLTDPFVTAAASFPRSSRAPAVVMFTTTRDERSSISPRDR